MVNHLETVREDFEKSPFWSFIGLEMKELKAGHVECRLPFNPAFGNVRDTVHGGIYASVLDTTMGIAARSVGNDAAMTIQMNIQFLKPVVQGAIYAEASIISESRSTILIEGKLFNEDKELVAHSVGTFKVSKREPLK